MNIITLIVLLVGIVFLLMGYTDIFYNTKSTEKVYELVKKGIPFREAYQLIALKNK